MQIGNVIKIVIIYGAFSLPTPMNKYIDKTARGEAFKTTINGLKKYNELGIKI